MYPLDDPPPYPGDEAFTSEEKQPLNPTDLYVTTEGPDDTPVTMALASDPHSQPVIALNGGLHNVAPSSLVGCAGPSVSLSQEVNCSSSVEPLSGTSSSYSYASAPPHHPSHYISTSSGHLEGYHNNHQGMNKGYHDHFMSQSSSSPQLLSQPMDIQQDLPPANANSQSLAQANSPNG